jgi:hypothetical protein
MSWDEGQTLAARFEHACTAAHDVHRHWRLGESYSGFTQALVRETPRLVEAITDRFRRQMRAMPERAWRFGDWVAFAVDGSRVEAPHTAANESDLGCAGRAKTAPQVYLTTVWHLGLGLPWDFRVGPGTASERHHALDMIEALPERALLVADAGFISYQLCRTLVRGGRSFLVRVGSNVRLLEQLGYYRKERGGIVYLWPTHKQAGHNKPLVVRLIRLKQGRQAVYLVTNVLERRQLSNRVARKLYQARWGEEVFYRSMKQTLQRRTLKSRTAATCRTECQWTLLGLWLLGLLTVSRIVATGQNPRAWSVARSRDLVRQAIRNESPRRGTRRPLRESLAQALTDTYRRRGDKTARNYPRQKKEKPPGPPRIEPPTPLELQRARRLVPHEIPKRWTA